MNRAVLRNHQESLLLLLIQVSFKKYLSRDAVNEACFGLALLAVLGMNAIVREPGGDRGEIPLLSLCIEQERDPRAAS